MVNIVIPLRGLAGAALVALMTLAAHRAAAQGHGGGGGDEGDGPLFINHGLVHRFGF